MAKYRKLSRTSSQRKALLRGQVTALLNNGKIVTTEAKAKEVRKIAEGLIALAVKEIIQAHGENINCISTEGVGTEFIFTLPIAKEHA